MQKEMVDAHQDGMDMVHIQIEEKLFDVAFPPYVGADSRWHICDESLRRRPVRIHVHLKQSSSQRFCWTAVDGRT